MPGVSHEIFLAVLSQVEKAETLSENSFIRALTPLTRAWPSWPKPLPGPHFLMPLQWALGFQHLNLVGDTNIGTRLHHLEMLLP